MDVKTLLKSLIITQEGVKEVHETVAVEVPFKIALNDVICGRSMVLPMQLEEFGVGYLFGLGYLGRGDVVKEVYVCPSGVISVYADVQMECLSTAKLVDTSGCGGTGKVSEEFLKDASFEEFKKGVFEYKLPLSEIGEFIGGVLKRNTLNIETHCVHACGFWSDGRLVAFSEDIGRHNAVDKIIGGIILGRYGANGAIYTTGRLTADMVLKCARIGIPIVISRSSASSLAVEIAKRVNITLIGYARPNRINVFNASYRVLF